MNEFSDLLKGGDLRSIAKSNKVVSLVDNQERFDELFQNLFDTDRIVVMRTADAVEKITLKNRAYLQKHKTEILSLCDRARDKELKWHLALLLSRLSLSENEFGKVWQKLTSWGRSKKESKIVRVNSLQGLADLLPRNMGFTEDFNLTLSKIGKEKIPSINARIKKLRNTCR